jgi:hypothetical protein
MRKILKNVVFLTLPAILISILFLEALARVTWPEKRGTPGFSGLSIANVVIALVRIIQVIMQVNLQI